MVKAHLAKLARKVSTQASCVLEMLLFSFVPTPQFLVRSLRRRFRDFLKETPKCETEWVETGERVWEDTTDANFESRSTLSRPRKDRCQSKRSRPRYMNILRVFQKLLKKTHLSIMPKRGRRALLERRKTRALRAILPVSEPVGNFISSSSPRDERFSWSRFLFQRIATLERVLNSPLSAQRGPHRGKPPKRTQSKPTLTKLKRLVRRSSTWLPTAKLPTSLCEKKVKNKRVKVRLTLSRLSLSLSLSLSLVS